MRIWEFAVRRWQFTLVLFALLVAMGIASLMSIPRAEDPKLNYPGAAVVVAYPGADPEDIEKLIVDPIEDAVSELDDVKKLTSDALDGIGIVDIEFFYGTDPDRKYDEVVREVNALRSGFPEGVVSVEIRRMKPSLVNIVQFALLSETAGWQQLKEHAEDLEDIIETVPGIRKAETWAYPVPEVRVAVELERLSRNGVTLAQLMDVNRPGDATIPGGAVDAGLRRYNLKNSGGYASLEEIASTVVSGRGGRIVRVRDVATVSWSVEEERYLGRYRGKRAVFITANPT